jgi:hypothetical protein
MGAGLPRFIHAHKGWACRQPSRILQTRPQNHRGYSIRGRKLQLAVFLPQRTPPSTLNIHKKVTLRMNAL